jgi:hypothetical protein
VSLVATGRGLRDSERTQSFQSPVNRGNMPEILDKIS